MRRNVVGKFVAALAVMLVMAAQSVQGQGTTGTIAGTVTIAGVRAPLTDVRVAVVGTVMQATSNVRGEYRLVNVPAGQQTLSFSRIGYKAERIRVSVVAGQTTSHDQALTESAANLAQVVVTGTAGNQERRAQAATVASIDASRLVESGPVSSVQELLTARTPGVSVNKASGSTGTASQIRIRGNSSISLSNTPLVFVDGVRVSEAQNSLGVNGQVTDRLNDISVDDIESIEIVKGPAAATLYGADASVGVIQIITKRGKLGSQKFTQSVRSEFGFIGANYSPPDNWGACTAALVLATSVNPLCRGRAVGTLVSDNPLKRTNAFRAGVDRSFGWTGRGGGQNYGYFISGGYDSQYGTLPNNELSRYNGRVNFSFTPDPKWALDASISFIRSFTQLPDNDNNIYGYMGGGLLGSPLSRRDDGVPGQDGWFGFARQVDAITAIRNSVQTHRNLYSLTANYTPKSWFTNRLTLGADLLRDEFTRFFPKNSIGVYAAALNGGSNGQTRQGFERMTVDYLGNMRGEWGTDRQWETNVSFGVQTIASRTENLSATGVGFVVNGNNTVGSASSTSGGQGYGEQTQYGLLGQLQVGYRNKIFVQVANRIDRFSSFGRPDDAFLLPKIGVTYTLSEESWFKLPWVSDFRVRAAYGETGRTPGAGAALQTFIAAPYAISATTSAAGAVPGNPGNASLKAERGTEFEAGADWSMFRNRVNFELTGFYKVTKDLLLQVPLPPSLGYQSNPFKNIGEVMNRGVEFAVNAQMIRSRDLQWDLRYSMNTLTNRLNSLSNAEGNVAQFPVGNVGRMIPGQQLGVLTSKRILAINPTTGVVTVDSGFRPINNVLPTFEAALYNSFRLGKYIQLSASIDTKRDFGIYNLTDYFRETQVVRDRRRLVPGAVSAFEWQRRYGNPTVGQPAFVQLGGVSTTVAEVREAFIQPGDFTRVRELAGTVTLPTEWMSKIGAATGAVTIAFQNVLLFSSYQGADPEVLTNIASQFDRSDFLTIPTPRRVIMRLNLTF